jgi:hypothetical protein
VDFRRHLGFLAAVLTGCVQPNPGDIPTAPSDGSRSSIAIEEFAFIEQDTTIPQVFGRLGAPSRDIGSGIHIYEYLLEDGSSVIIGSPDASVILYVRHGDAVLFQRK